MSEEREDINKFARLCAMMDLIRNIIESTANEEVSMYKCIETVLYDMMSAMACKYVEEGRKASEFVSYIEGIMKHCWKVAKEHENGIDS